jgi:putative regulator of septum formation
MSRRWLGVLVFLVAVALAVAGGYRLTRPKPATGGATAPPAAAPAVPSCWTVDEAGARTPFPWPGTAVDCAGEHSVEVFFVSQVDPQLVAKAAKAKGDEATLAQNLMYAQARRACTVLANSYLGGSWHSGRLLVLADWVAPARSGHFGCALAETSDPAGTHFVRRSGSLRGAMSAGDASPLAAACMNRAASTDGLAYVGCDRPHDGEFVGTYTVTPPDAPFDENGVRTAVNRGCAQTALAYLGLPADGSRADLSVGYVGPTKAADWLGSDQVFSCYVLSTRDKLRGSVKGLGTKPLPR